MLNVVALNGRLTADPELKYTPNGVAVVSFCVAVDHNAKAADGTYKTSFINVLAWRGTAEFIARHFVKGQFIAINGELQSRKYLDKSGNNRTVIEVLANGVNFCGEKKTAGGNETESSGDLQEMSVSDFRELVSNSDDVPF